MEYLTPHSWNELVDEIRKLSDAERHELIVDNYDCITESYADSFDNGLQLGSIVVLGGIQAAYAELETIPEEKYVVAQELFGGMVENESELQQVLHEYSDEMAQAVSRTVSMVNNDEFQIYVLQYMLSLALYGTENKAGIDRIKTVFDSIFNI